MNYSVLDLKSYKNYKITEIKTDVISAVIMTINVFSLHIAIYNQSYKSQNVRF